MTEAAFFGWIRSLLRMRYMRGWKWEYQCADCKDWFLRKEVDIDHIVPCGTLKSFKDLSLFCERLFVEKEGLQVLCKVCHKKKTHDT